MKKHIVTLATALTFATPLLASAQAQVTNITQLGQWIVSTINNLLVPIIFAIAFIVFLWGAFQVFIMGAQSEEAKDKGKNLMLWGLIGFFVMVSVWGLVNILVGTFNFNSSQPTAPQTTQVGNVQ